MVVDCLRNTKILVVIYDVYRCVHGKKKLDGFCPD